MTVDELRALAERSIIEETRWREEVGEDGIKLYPESPIRIALARAVLAGLDETKDADDLPEGSSTLIRAEYVRDAMAKAAS